MFSQITRYLAQTSFRHQLSILVFTGLFAVVIVAAIGASWVASRVVAKDYLQHGESLVQAFAKQSALALLYASENSAKEATSMVTAFHDVKQAAIFNEKDELLFQSAHIQAWNKSKKESSVSPLLEFEDGGFWQFTAPVVVSFEKDGLAETQNKVSKLGFVKLLLSKTKLFRIQKQIFVSITFLAIATGILLFIALQWLLKRMTSPLQTFAETMHQAEAHGAGLRVDLSGSKELLQMSKAFNTMMHALEEREIKIKQHQAQLAHVSRLKTVGEMASGIAHELNQPLTAMVHYIGGCVERLKQENVSPQIIEVMLRVNALAEHAGDIIHRLKNFLRKGELRKEPMDMNALIREVLKLSELELLEAKVEVILHFLDKLPKVNVDKIHIEQILLNLVQNAIDAMRSVEEKARKLTFETLVDGENVIKVLVSDTGPGISDDLVDKIFDPFFTTKESGMGIGLSISSSIIETHGGKLTVESNFGFGSRFILTLPIKEEV